MNAKTLEELAAYVGGSVRGDAAVPIHSVSTLESAKEGEITFLANRKYKKLCLTTKASAIIAAEELESPASLLITEDPYYAFAQIMDLFYGKPDLPESCISPKSAIAQSAQIGENTCIGDFVSVEENTRIGRGSRIYPGVSVGKNVQIGENCVLFPNVVVYENCRIGNRVRIHANTTVGQDGFGYATHRGIHHKIVHIGRVIIEDDAELGAGCAIERGALDDTVIGKGCKIGDHVVIGHGTRIGPHCLLVPQVGIAGSVVMGHHCVAGGQVGIAGHLKIGSGVMIGAQSGVGDDIPDGTKIFGSPAFEALRAKRAYSLIKSLPDMWKSLRKMEKKLAETADAEEHGTARR
ncbi:MAG: UDP-3-O-(3-hydroxymyristoyl)glucosamine N-acyltransferase [Desulfobacterales bacterium]